MNINEFVDTITMQLSDLENFAHLGYADGVSNWGMNLMRFGEFGVVITEELHKKKVEEKVQWYKEDAEKKAAAIVEAKKIEAAKNKE